MSECIVTSSRWNPPAYSNITLETDAVVRYRCTKLSGGNLPVKALHASTPDTSNGGPYPSPVHVIGAEAQHALITQIVGVLAARLYVHWAASSCSTNGTAPML
eukprot:GHVS01003602.1.p1 GENE.GHVS01003602.1~~GHVS01003602.1.p1  ORF type:complete len:103 (-),score=4.92 GHVS01003602.1:496-804(-)